MKQSELDKHLQVAAKAEAKARRWKFARSTAYWTQGPLFFSMIFSAGAKERSFHAYLRFKWLDLDQLLWRVLGMSSNEHEPFSLHATGAFVISGWEICSTITREVQWDDPDAMQQQVQNAGQRAASRAQEVATLISSLDSYVSFLQREHEIFMRSHPQAAVTVWKEILLAALLRGDKAAAAQLARERITVKDSGGFIVGGKSFYEHALALAER